MSVSPPFKRVWLVKTLQRIARITSASAFAIGGLLAPSAAGALSLEQAREACIESVGRPNVQACMQSLKGSGDREANLAKCRAGVFPKVRACVQAALHKANGRANVAITIEGGAKKEVVDLGRALPAGFVPPPRTINDIASVLDSQKPDPKSYADMKAQADAEPEPGSPNAATFYIDRGNTRLTFGRVDEALADAQKPLQVAGDVHSANYARLFIGIVKVHQGDPKGALQIFQDIHRAATAQHLVGWIVNSSWNIILNSIAVGDVAQAEGYLRR